MFANIINKTDIRFLIIKFEIKIINIVWFSHHCKHLFIRYRDVIIIVIFVVKKLSIIFFISDIAVYKIDEQFLLLTSKISVLSALIDVVVVIIVYYTDIRLKWLSIMRYFLCCISMNEWYWCSTIFLIFWVRLMRLIWLDEINKL